MDIIDNTFGKTITEQRAGACLADCSTKLAELVSAVRATGKGGKFKLELTITPASRGDAVCLMVQDDVSLKLPRLERGSSIFYADDNNLLQRADPRQKEFALREVKPAEPAEAAPLREVKPSPMIAVATVSA